MACAAGERAGAGVVRIVFMGTGYLGFGRVSRGFLVDVRSSWVMYSEFWEFI